ncbi:hypothetical protein EDD17DRAFT_1432805, partial [Pisolithus thermaeus]
MGLAGRKVKQRIPADPRNLSWADDASRFGQAYLSKFGWDAAQGVGLGASGDGMKSHLKVSHKLDMLGIGAAHKNDPHGIAWKQNKDFEALLKRLNEGTSKDDEKEEKNGVVEQGGDKKQKRKRKHLDEGDGSRERDKKRKKKQTRPMVSGPSPRVATWRTSIPMSHTSDISFLTLINSHRARFQAAKRLATKSTAAISEVLGIAPSSSTPSSLLATPKRSSSTPESSSTSEDTHPSLEKLTTSTKNLADYFRDKLAAKKSMASTPIPADADEDYAPPRGGLGASRASLPSPGADEGPQRIGLGFASSTSTNTPAALEST